MAQPLAPGALSLTAAGAALVTDGRGDVAPAEVAGLLVDDVRAVSTWKLHVDGATPIFVGRTRTGPSRDELLFTLRVPDVIDPVALLVRRREVDGRGFRDTVAVRAYGRAVALELRLVAGRDDRTMYEIGEPGRAVGQQGCLVDDPEGLTLSAPADRGDVDGDRPTVRVEAPGWTPTPVGLTACLSVAPGAEAAVSVGVTVAGTDRPARVEDDGFGGAGWSIESEPAPLATAALHGARDLTALRLPYRDRVTYAAGSPFFLAVFGRDSLIAGIQSLLGGPDRLLGVLDVLAATQATAIDPRTGAQPGRIVHELRVGRAGVFGLAPGVPYYGAVDTAALFGVALGEAMRWGAPRERIAALLPAARRALEWCATAGDVDGDGFVESVPHESGLVNLHWKDSGDSIVDEDGTTIVGTVSPVEVQAYWYRAARSLAAAERWCDVGDGAALDAEADRLAAAFVDRFMYESATGPFVGLALGPDKRLLAVPASNAGHVLWAEMLPPDLALAVADTLAGPGLHSGWGVRTVSAAAPGYNPFGYHRGTVWPHDTAIALHGAARAGATAAVRTLATGLVDLAAACGGELPELISGIDRASAGLPVPYPAACRPQAWAAGTPLLVVRALLGLEPDVPAGVLRLAPRLPEGHTLSVRGIPIGAERVSITARGDQVLAVDAGRLHVEG